jgi:hypothetical protein
MPLRQSVVDKQAHAPCSLSLSAKLAHAPGSTSSKNERALAPGLSSSDQMWSLLPTIVVLAVLAFAHHKPAALAFAPHEPRARVPITWTSPWSQREMFDEQAHAPCSLSSSAEPAHAPGSTSSKDEWACMPVLSLSDQMWSLPPTMVVLVALAFAHHEPRAWVPTTRTSPWSKRERYDEQAHVPCLSNLSSEPAHAPGSTNSNDELALAPGSSSSDQMWSLPPTMVVSAALASGVPTTHTPPADQRRGVGKWVQLPDLPSSWDNAAHMPGPSSSWDGLVCVPSPSTSGRYDTLDTTAVEGLLEASRSPLEVPEGGSRTRMPLTAVLMVLSRDTTISRLPPAPGGMSAAVMAMPMAWMPGPFDGAGLSQGGRGEGHFCYEVVPAR